MRQIIKLILLCLWLSLCGCGGGVERIAAGGGGGGGTQPPAPNIAGNWQLRLTSTAGTPPATIAGNIAQSDGSLSGALHLDGSNCFDPANTVGVTGTRSDNNISLTSTSIAGQVITFTGKIANNTAVGTYEINGGCADGDQGSIEGFKIPVLTGGWRGRTNISDQLGDLIISLSQGSASADGTFGLSGTTTKTTYPVCEEGAIASGTLTTTGSWIIGTRVFLQIQTANGRVDFSGTADQAGFPITGGLHYVGGPCDGLLGEATFRR